MFSVDDKNLKQYVRNLQAVSSVAYPKAVRSTLDRMAFIGLKEYKKNVRQKFVIRNAKSNIILKSLRYEKCSGTLDINKMEAKTGQAATTFGKTTDQMRKQEFGEYIHSNANHIMKPTKAARGGSYKRAVQPQNFLSKIKVSRIEDLVKHPARTEFKQFRQAIGFARHNPDKPFYFLPSENSYFGINGIAEMNGKDESKTAKFLYSIKEKSQKLKRIAALEPVGDMVGKRGAEIFKHEAQRRITRELQKGVK